MKSRGGKLGVGLYLITLCCELIVGGSARFVLGYVVFSVADVVVGLPLDGWTFGVYAAFAPAVYSMLGVLYPLRGWWWQRRHGARRPSIEEQERIEAAAAELADRVEGGLPVCECYVLDDVKLFAAVRGRAVILSRGLVESDGLGAKLGHELGHVVSLDGRLTEGLHRMRVWDDPLREGTRAAGVDGYDPVLEGGGGLLFGCARWLVRLAGGGEMQSLLSPVWGWYWRQREYAADAYAASLGKGEELVRYLEECELAVDGPQAGLWRSEHEHPFVALRIERLRMLNDAG